MPFNMLISKCLCNGLLIEDNNVKVCIDRQDNEKVLFFKIDNDDFKGYIYDGSYIPENGRKKGCDGLIYYRNIYDNNDIFCFVELKVPAIKEKLEEAVEQLTNSKQGFKNKLKKIPVCNQPSKECKQQDKCIKRNEPTNLFPQIKWLAYIRYEHMSAPIDTDIYRDKLIKYGKDHKKIFDDACILTEKDIGFFLRGEKN